MSSTSMAAVSATGNTELAECTQPALRVRTAKESSTSPERSPAPTHGFALLDAADRFVSWHECPVDACDAFKANDGLYRIVRCSDGALIKPELLLSKRSRRAA